MGDRLDWNVGSLGVNATCLNKSTEPAVRALLISRGFKILDIDLQGLESSRDLFFHLMAGLPCDPEC